jgi:choice-of-anchor B domain-containing protein
MPSRGPAYGKSIAMDAVALDGPLHLKLTLRSHDPNEQRIACPEFPLEMNFSIDAVELRRDEAAPPLLPAGSVDTANMTLVGSLDPEGPSPGNDYNDVWGYSDGNVHLALLGGIEGTHIIDVTDPTNPVEVEFIPGLSSPWRDLKTYLHYVYVVTEAPGGGLQIIDLSDPLNPVLVKETTEYFSTCHNIYIDGAAGQAWAVGTNNGSRMLDLSDPLNPVEIGSYTNIYVHDAFARNDKVYLSEIFNGTHRIFDTTDPQNLQQVSVFTTPTAFTHNSWHNVAETLLVTTDETNPGGHVGVYDGTDLSNPVLLSEYNPNPSAIVHNVKFDDDDDEVIAMSHYGLGIKYVDLHVPTQPVELGGYDTHPNGTTGFSGAWGIYAFDPRGYLYASDRGTGLYIVEYTPSGGTLSGIVTDASTDQPVPNAQIVLISEGEVLFTGQDGRYARLVGAGPVLVRASAVGYKTRIIDGDTMVPGSRVDLDIALEKLPEVPLTGVVRNANDLSPVEGATVSLVDTQLSTVSAADGTFQFPNAAVGQRIVTAEAFGFSSGEARALLGPSQSGTVEVLLEPAVFVDTAETDQGWAMTQIGFNIQGRWERVDPNGTGGGSVQPEDDRTPAPGTTAFVTGQSPPGADTDANDVEGEITTLLSPAIDLNDAGVARLRYHRWVSNNSNIFPAGALRAWVSGNDGQNFIQLENQNTSANQWLRREFDIGSFVSLSDSVRIRFTAEPGPNPASLQTLECGVDDVDVVRACVARFSPGVADSDADTIIDACDACPTDPANDADADGFCGNVDNSPFVGSPGQDDADGDGVGDVADNCPAVSNSAQGDLDGDGLGDLCDPDVDGDGTPVGSDPDVDNDGIDNVSDNCPFVVNPAQEDVDADLQGDACDLDDGIVTGVTLAAGDLITWQAESDAARYNIYRGELGAEVLLPLSECRLDGLTTPYFVDLDVPNPGDGFLYLVTRVDSQGNEGSLGRKSNGVERAVNVPCP